MKDFGKTEYYDEQYYYFDDVPQLEIIGGKVKMTAKAYNPKHNAVCFVTVYIDPKTLKASMTGFRYPPSDENILEKYYDCELPGILFEKADTRDLQRWGVCPYTEWGVYGEKEEKNDR